MTKILRLQDVIRLRRRIDSHKGDNGRVLILAGSEDYVGAAVLCGLACYATGADMVTVAAPRKVAWAINAYSPDIITKKLDGNYFTTEHLGIVKKLADRNDVILIGNGVGLHRETKELVRKVVRIKDKLFVIDADAIKSISDAHNSIITPHQAELEIFLSNINLNVDKKKNISDYAAILQIKLKSFLNKNNVILLKGRTDAVISADSIRLNKTGNVGMTVGGTGDVLAGLCAGFLAQTRNLFRSACSAAFVNGAVGDIVYKEKGYGLIASDIVREIPYYLKRKKIFI